MVVVAGPPCAGKSTLAETLRRAGDLIVDFDVIAQGCGSAGKWMHSRAVGDAAEREVQRLIRVVADLEDVRAWVVRGVPDPAERIFLARRVRADRVLVLLPPVGVLGSRARARPRPEETLRAIWRWRDRYLPADGDELIRDGLETL